MAQQEVQAEPSPLPKMKVAWIRGYEKIDFKRPHTYLVLGQRGSGKSSLLETLAPRYQKIIDLFGSRDNEALAWCRAPHYSSNEILFITGDSVEVKSQWDSIPISKLRLGDLKSYDVALTVNAFYSSIEEEFHGLNELMKILWRRTSWRDPWFLMVREASNFIYSRIKIVKNQSIAKADFIHVLRQARHMGYAVGVDTIRWTSIDKEIRDVSDYIFIKRVGVLGLPSDLRWLYRYIVPASLMNPGPNLFVLICNRGPVALGKFQEIPWHKKEKEDLLRLLDIQVETGEVPDYGDTGHRRVGDHEHSEILSEYQEIRNMGKVGQKVGRSPATVQAHIHDHNRAVERLGFCEKCRRVKSPLDEVLISISP